MGFDLKSVIQLLALEAWKPTFDIDASQYRK